jgi:hypothetical protein
MVRWFSTFSESDYFLERRSGMKQIQLTVEVPDDLDSIDHLELYVNQLGQKIKPEILSTLLSQIIDRHKQSELDSSACPDCKKNEASRSEAVPGC